VAYEHTLQVREHRSAQLAGSIFVPSSSTWLPLQWAIAEEDHIAWSHRFDRLVAEVGGGAWDAAVGRQPISWATTLFLTPADPFAPFDPSDPFREYRAGVDAARVRYYPGPLSEVDLVVRLADTECGVATTALVRTTATVRSVDLSAWAGLVYDDFGAAVAATGSVGGYQLRGEAAVRRDADDTAVLRLAVGVDRRVDLAGRDMYLVLEYQHDGFGAGDAADLSRVVGSDPFRRGELQVLGRDELAGQASWQWRPLWRLELTSLANINDGSGLLIPAAAYSLAADLTLRAGVFFSYGNDTVDPRAGILGSEHGVAPTTAYLSASWFF